MTLSVPLERFALPHQTQEKYTHSDLKFLVEACSDPQFHEGKFTYTIYSVIVPEDYSITLSVNSWYHKFIHWIPVLELQIERFNIYYIATWRNLQSSSSVHNSIRVKHLRCGSVFFFSKLERRTNASNPPLHRAGHHTQHLPNIFQYNLYWPLTPTLCFAFALWKVEMQG
jgi:hypothetical protein